MHTAIDHIVIGAATLEQGANYVKKTLGVDLPFGGIHKKMGTHNLLMKLGDKVFLEVIAVCPGIPAPPRPRWFGLDDPHVRQCIEAEPALLAWVVNTRDIQSLMRAATVSFGRPERISRGDLSWYFGLPEDGRLLAGGLLPYLMEWQTEAHPAGAMKDAGCSFRGITLYHANATWLDSILKSIGMDSVKIESLPDNSTPYIVATIDTPDGLKNISGIAAHTR